MYAATGFKNDLDWVIISQENTGSHPHNDPDLTGAWNYLINGYKWWVIFPNGRTAKNLPTATVGCMFSNVFKVLMPVC